MMNNVKLGALAALLLMIALPPSSYAAAWRLNDLVISGDLNFVDDFEDGLRGAPPTSSLIDTFGNTTEAAGSLLFDSLDGGFLVSLPPFPDALRDVTVLNQAVINLPGGGTSVRGSFQPMLTDIANGTPVDGYGIFITSFSGGAFLGVFQDFLGNPSAIYLDETNTAIGIDTINLGAVTGDIVLELSLDQTTDFVTPRYSIDGGTTFIDYGSWAFSSGLVDVDYNPLFPGDFVGVGAYGQTAVPIPAAAWLFVTALGVLGRNRRTPKNQSILV